VRLPLLGPRDVLRLLGRGATGAERLLAAGPRLLALLEDSQRLLARVDALIDRIESTRADADAVVRRTAEVSTQAGQLVARTSPLVDRLAPLLDGLEPPLVQLQPTLQRLAETTDPREVDAMVALVDHLPGLAARMETDILPVLDSLRTVSPDVHDLLDVTRELNEMLASVPGLGRLKRRIDAEQEAEGRGR
jgi:ABC-type transporter Mla subunit MlaD